MTYLFLVIGLSVVNALASKKISMIELGIVNSFIFGLTYFLEFGWQVRSETQKLILFEDIELVRKGREAELKEELERRTGLSIQRVEVGKINFLDDTAQVRIFYHSDEQHPAHFNEND